jgi:hypothetical protein
MSKEIRDMLLRHMTGEYVLTGWDMYGKPTQEVITMSAVGPGFMVGGDKTAEEVRRNAVVVYGEGNTFETAEPSGPDSFEPKHDPFDPKNWGV